MSKRTAEYFVVTTGAERWPGSHPLLYRRQDARD
jgi:hypothetical protein